MTLLIRSFGQLDDLLPESMWGQQVRSVELSIEDGSFSKAKLNAELNKQGTPNLEKLPRSVRRKIQKSRIDKAALEDIQKEIDSNSGRMQIGETFQGVRRDSKKLAQNPSLFTEQFGVLSLTDKPDNLLMWAHYAASHRGFVIELESKHPFFSFPANPTHSALRKVDYVERRNVSTLISEGDNPYRAFFLKSNYWSYESEWRLVRALQDADRKLEGNIYLFELPEMCVSRVILGLNIKAELKIKVLDLLKRMVATNM